MIPVITPSCKNNEEKKAPVYENEDARDTRIVSEYLSGSDNKKDSAVGIATNSYFYKDHSSWEANRKYISVLQKAWGDDSTASFVYQGDNKLLVKMWSLHKDDPIYIKTLKLGFSKKDMGLVYWLAICNPDTLIQMLKYAKEPEMVRSTLIFLEYDHEQVGEEYTKKILDIIPDKGFIDVDISSLSKFIPTDRALRISKKLDFEKGFDILTHSQVPKTEICQFVLSRIGQADIPMLLHLYRSGGYISKKTLYNELHSKSTEQLVEHGYSSFIDIDNDLRGDDYYEIRDYYCNSIITSVKSPSDYRVAAEFFIDNAQYFGKGWVELLQKKSNI